MTATTTAGVVGMNPGWILGHDFTGAKGSIGTKNTAHAMILK
jgi:hypothetical protein